MAKTKMTISASGMAPIETTVEDFTGTAEAQLIKIKSGQLKDPYCNYSYEQRVAFGVTNKISVKSQVRFHPDLKKAIQLFNGHLAAICEEVSHKDISDIDECQGTKPAITDKLMTFTVDSFNLTGSGDDGGIILIGQKLLTTGESVKLETPEVMFSSEYPFSNELYAATNTVIEEMMAYHLGEKEAPEPQKELDFNTEEVEAK